jgi:hypothetical protein
MTSAIDLEVAIETGEACYEAAHVSQFRFLARALGFETKAKGNAILLCLHTLYSKYIIFLISLINGRNPLVCWSEIYPIIQNPNRLASNAQPLPVL